MDITRTQTEHSASCGIKYLIIFCFVQFNNKKPEFLHTRVVWFQLHFFQPHIHIYPTFYNPKKTKKKMFKRAKSERIQTRCVIEVLIKRKNYARCMRSHKNVYTKVTALA